MYLNFKHFPYRFKWLILWLGYFLFWFLSRYPALTENVLFADDFFHWADTSRSILENSSCRLPPKDFRWLFDGMVCLSQEYFPKVAISAVPKLFAGICLSGLCVVMCNILVRWKAASIVAVLLPVVLLSHPVTNEITLWNTTSLFPFWLLLAATGYLLLRWSTSPIYTFLGVAALVFVLFSYEYYLVLFFMFIVGEYFVCSVTDKDIRIRKSLYLVGVFLALSIIYVIQTIITAKYFGSSQDGTRGLIEVQDFPSYLSLKVHGVFNLVVNCFMTPLSLYMRIEKAWSIWMWIPVGLQVLLIPSVWFYKKDLKMLVIALVGLPILTILPTLPIFVAGQSPEGWRTSVLVVLGVLLGSLPIFHCSYEILRVRVRLLDRPHYKSNIFTPAPIYINFLLLRRLLWNPNYVARKTGWMTRS